MYAAVVSNFSLWWLLPLVMIFLCFLMMRGRKGSGDVLKKVNNLKTNRYRKKETSMNDRGAFLCDAAESSFLI
jgi:hypothetical protein